MGESYKYRKLIAQLHEVEIRTQVHRRIAIAALLSFAISVSVKPESSLRHALSDRL